MEIPELVPVADYKSKEAELKASISWLLTKAYGQDIPPDYRQMFYEDDKGVEYIAPVIVQGLTRADIYCKACSNIFREKVTAHGQGHQVVMQLLSRRGIYVTEGKDAAVTDTMLKLHKPVHLNAHMALIRALIKAHTQEVVTVERVVKAVRSYTTFSASSELPCDTEATVVLWINKACSVMRARLELSEQQNTARVPTPRKPVSELDKPGIPVIEDFMKDICDGCCLASLISFYCPDTLRFQDIALKESLNIADSLYNLQLVQLFADQHLTPACLHLTINDLFYAPTNLKSHMLAFVAELFRAFEIDPAKSARHDPALAGDGTTEPAEGSPSALRKFRQPGGISSATRRSFNNNPGGGSGGGRVGSPMNIPERASSGGSDARLLPRRLNQTKTALQNGGIISSSPSIGATGKLSHSIRAWGESDQSVYPKEGSADGVSPLRGRVSQQSKSGVTSLQQSCDSNSTLLANVSIDTSLDLSSDVSLDLSGDESAQSQRSEFVNSVSKPGVTARMQSDMELESVSSRASAVSLPGSSSQRDSQKEALTPAKLKPAKEKSNTHTKEIESGDIHSKDNSAGSTPEEYSTPSAENIAFVDSIRKKTAKPESNVVPQSTPVAMTSATPAATLQLLRSHVSGAETSTRVMTNTQSFTISNHRHTPDSARAAGIPVVAQRRGSVGERSSSDGSDQELHKIHADHRDHEIKDSFYLHGSSTLVDGGAPRLGGEIHRPTSLSMQGSPCASGRVNTRAAVVGEGDDAGDQSRLSLVEQFQRGKGEATSSTVKRTTFAELPNQTTWQERALKNQQSGESRDAASSEDGDVQPLPSELLGVRMRLVEQRRQIELGKRRAEMQWTKQREELGKQAFIQVISKGKAVVDNLAQQEADVLKESKPPVVPGLGAQTAVFSSELDEAVVKETQTPASVDVPTRHRQTNTVEEKQDRMPRDITRVQHRRRADDIKERQVESSPQRQWPNDNTGTEKVVPRSSPESPKSFQAAEPDEASRHEPDYPPLSMQSTALLHSSQENLQEYGTSLNKLNSSLTELQGEIMRLSLQQDRIKSAQVSPPMPPQLASVVTSPEVIDAISSSPSSPTSSQSYIQRQGITGGEPDIGGTVPSHKVAPSFSQTGAMACATTVYSQVPMPYSHSYGTPPQYPHTQFPPQYVPAYPYPGMPGGPPPSVYGQPSVYQAPPGTYPNMPGQLAWHMAAQPPAHMQAPVSMVTTSPLSTYQPDRHMAQTYTVAAQNHHIISPQRSDQPPPLNFAATYVARRGNNTPGTPPGVPGTPPGGCCATSGATLVGHGDSPYAAEEGSHYNGAEVWSRSPDRPTAVPAEGDGQSPKQKDGGFFITLDAGSPQKQKPKLGSMKRKDSTTTPRTSTSSEPTASPVKVSSPVKVASPVKVVSPVKIASPVREQVLSFSSPARVKTPKHEATPVAVNASPSVGFVIGQDDMSSPDPSDLEKRREKFIEQQMRRREEQDRRKLQLESDAAKKRELNRLKQEQSEQKKAEEKTRREAIFQQYLQKKAEQDAAEEGVAPRRHPTPGNRTARLAARPKSQPPVSHDDRVSHSSSHSSQEEIFPPGRSPVLDLKLTPVPPSGPTDSGYTPPFGGFTQRWPGTPDKTSRPAIDNHNSDMGTNPPSQYSGPKLFVTPSQKSNRHIIANAISHRCLAGTVNQEVKNRVLEVISQSEAKHFIILFRDAGLQYRGVYTYHPEREEVFKIQGVGPKQITNKAIERFYKYNSGTKAFTEVASTKHLSATIDAVVLQNSMWQKKQVARKPPAGQY